MDPFCSLILFARIKKTAPLTRGVQLWSQVTIYSFIACFIPIFLIYVLKCVA